MRRVRFFAIVFAVVALTAIVLIAQSAPDSAVRDGVFIHITHGTDSPHHALMALKMAELMADDHDVLVYCDITGVELVLKDAPDLKFEPFASSQTALKNLLDKGAIVMACPGCLKAAGKSETDLAQGIRIADKKKFFDFTKGRLLSFDY